MSPWEQIGSNLHRIRRERHMTQEELSALTGVSQQYLSKLKGGLRNPTVTILIKIAARLGVSLFPPLEGLDEMPKKPARSKPERRASRLRASRRVANAGRTAGSSAPRTARRLSAMLSTMVT